MTDKKLKVALIGCGRMGMHHVKAIQVQENAEIVAVADPAANTDKLISEIGQEIGIFNDAREMLDKTRPDVVHIVTPPDSHTALAMLALEYGAHIYVEKPFSLSSSEAKDVIAYAQERGLKACAAHQVLFHNSGTEYRKHLPLIGKVVHVESYFSFKTVRKTGSGLMSPVEQLEDILPHPVYLLLSVLEEQDKNCDPVMHSFSVDPRGEIRAIITNGDILAVLVVSLQGRPIDSYLKVCGTNGSINANFVLKGVEKLPGPGASAISAVLQPFSQARQMVFGTFASVFRMIFRKHKSYAGLAELLQLFYESILNNTPPPLSTGSIIKTVDICERIGIAVRAADVEAEKLAEQELADTEGRLVPVDSSNGAVLVTGGTGFLGRELVSELRNLGWPVRVIARKVPSASRRIAGIEYVKGDIARDITDDYFNDVSVVVHLAAETVGGKEEHERNTILATKNIVTAAIRNNVSKFVNISSIAVLKPGKMFGKPLNEDSPVDSGNLGRGPYVWAKSEAENIVADLCSRNNVQHKTIRLGPLVDFRHFTPPGRLGREVGTLFVAMGSPRGQLSVCDVRTASNVIRAYVEDFSSAPDMLNLIEAPAPRRRDLVEKLRTTRPELSFFWLPAPVLKFLSLLLKGILIIVRRGKKPLDLYAAFSAEKYDSTLAGKVINNARKP